MNPKKFSKILKALNNDFDGYVKPSKESLHKYLSEVWNMNDISIMNFEKWLNENFIWKD